MLFLKYVHICTGKVSSNQKRSSFYFIITTKLLYFIHYKNSINLSKYCSIQKLCLTDLTRLDFKNALCCISSMMSRFLKYLLIVG